MLVADFSAFLAHRTLVGGVVLASMLVFSALVWYYGTISQIQLVYGSLTTAIAVLVSVELGAIVLLIGAQVIAEYERAVRTWRAPVSASDADNFPGWAE